MVTENGPHPRLFPAALAFAAANSASIGKARRPPSVRLRCRSALARISPPSVDQIAAAAIFTTPGTIKDETPALFSFLGSRWPTTEARTGQETRLQPSQEPPPSPTHPAEQFPPPAVAVVFYPFAFGHRGVNKKSTPKQATVSTLWARQKLIREEIGKINPSKENLSRWQAEYSRYSARLAEIEIAAYARRYNMK